MTQHDKMFSHLKWNKIFTFNAIDLQIIQFPISYQDYEFKLKTTNKSFPEICFHQPKRKN